MLSAFQSADPSISAENFLQIFQRRCCYLIDLCPEPVDQLNRTQRSALRQASEQSLAQQIKHLQPKMIAPVLRSIVKNVTNAISIAAWSGPILELPYPGRWSRHREAFIHAIVPTIRRLSE